MKIQSFFNKKNLIVGTLALSLFTTFMFSLQLQKPQLLSTSSRAMELPLVNIPAIIIPTIRIGEPIVLPTFTPIQNIPVSNPPIQIPQLPLISTGANIPDLGSFFSQGASLIQQILANPDAKQIIAMFLGNILSNPKRTPSPSSPSTPPSPTNVPQQPVPTSAPQIVLQSCKEGDGTKINTCPARYPEGDKFVYRQCGATGWCSYTCFKPNTQEVIPCWDGLKQKVMTACNKLPCTCSDKEKHAIKSCPVLYPENGIETFRGCDISKGGIVGEDSIQWCNYTCFKPGTNDIVDCWPGQHTWITPTAAPQNQPTLPAGGTPLPTSAPTAKCHGKVPAIDLLKRPASEWELPNNTKSPCVCENTPLGTVCAQLSCSCPGGVCECEDMPLKMPPVDLTCSNGGSASNVKCEPQ